MQRLTISLDDAMAMVEEVAATADLLSDQAEQLSASVAAFKLAEKDELSDNGSGSNARGTIGNPIPPLQSVPPEISGDIPPQAQMLTGGAPRPMLPSAPER